MASRTRSRPRAPASESNPSSKRQALQTPRTRQTRQPQHPQHKADAKVISDLKRGLRTVTAMQGSLQAYLDQRVAVFERIMAEEDTAEKVKVRQDALRASRMYLPTLVTSRLQGTPLPGSFKLGRAVVHYLYHAGPFEDILMALRDMHHAAVQQAVPEVTATTLEWVNIMAPLRTAIEPLKALFPLHAVVNQLARPLKGVPEDYLQNVMESLTRVMLNQEAMEISLQDSPDNCEWDLGRDCDSAFEAPAV